MVSEIEKQCKHETEKWMVKCVIYARTYFFPKEEMSLSIKTSDLGNLWQLGK